VAEVKGSESLVLQWKLPEEGGAALLDAELVPSSFFKATQCPDSEALGPLEKRQPAKSLGVDQPKL
jgi:hypothetical protein